MLAPPATQLNARQPPALFDLPKPAEPHDAPTDEPTEPPPLPPGGQRPAARRMAMARLRWWQWNLKFTRLTHNFLVDQQFD
jgi:hypothetical protein